MTNSRLYFNSFPIKGTWYVMEYFHSGISSVYLHLFLSHVSREADIVFILSYDEVE